MKYDERNGGQSEEETKSKRAFHMRWTRKLRVLASQLGLTISQYDVRSNKAGPAVLGEVTLHTERLYLQVGGSLCTAEKPTVMYRTCKGRKDYTGGQNRWMPIGQIETPGAIETFARIQSGEITS